MKEGCEEWRENKESQAIMKILQDVIQAKVFFFYMRPQKHKLTYKNKQKECHSLFFTGIK